MPLYVPHSDADVYLDETNGQRAQLAESKVGGAAEAFVTLTREAQVWFPRYILVPTIPLCILVLTIPLYLSRVLRSAVVLPALACKHLPTRPRPCPVLITTPSESATLRLRILSASQELNVYL